MSAPGHRLLTPRERVEVLDRLQAMGAVCAAARGATKNPVTQRRKLEGGWRSHHLGGHLRRGLEEWKEGKHDGLILWPGTIRRKDSSTLCSMDGDTPHGYASLHSDDRLAYVEDNPARPGHCHGGAWFPEGVRAGNARWSGGEVRHLPMNPDDPRIGGVLRLYPGEAHALLDTAESPTLPRDEALAFCLEHGVFKPAPPPPKAGRAKAPPAPEPPSPTAAPGPQAPTAEASPPLPARTSDFPWLDWYTTPLSAAVAPHEGGAGNRDCIVFAHAVLRHALCGGEVADIVSALNDALPCPPLDRDQILSIRAQVSKHSAWLLERPGLLSWYAAQAARSGVGWGGARQGTARPAPAPTSPMGAGSPRKVSGYSRPLDTLRDRQRRRALKRGRQQQLAAIERDDAKVHALAREGLSGRAIAKALAIHIGRVQRSLTRIR